MNDMTSHFSNPFFPAAQLVVYRAPQTDPQSNEEYYIEAFDIDKSGFAINGHPLTVKECTRLAEALQCSTELDATFLQSEGLLPENVLYLNSKGGGKVVWYTPAQKVNLLFKDSLNIPSGKSSVPALVWMTTKANIWVYALSSKGRPTARTKLCYAPFFNISDDGKVCMGNVRIRISKHCTLETFMSQWESYFFNSYFSHMIESESPVNGNIVQLWQQLVDKDLKFPTKILKKTTLTLKNLIR